MAFHGRQGRGAMRNLRELKAQEAAQRDATPTPVENTKAYRLGPTIPRDARHGGPYRTAKSIRNYQAGENYLATQEDE